MFYQLPDEPAGRDYVYRPHPDAEGACGPQPGVDVAVGGARPHVPLRMGQAGTFNFV